MIDETKEAKGQEEQDLEGDLVVQELFFENYAVPDTTRLAASEPIAPEGTEKKGLVRRVARSAMLGLLMLGSLLFAGITMSGRRRRPSMLESLRRRFAY